MGGYGYGSGGIFPLGNIYMDLPDNSKITVGKGELRLWAYIL